MREDGGMQDDRDEYEPIIATRPHRQHLREESQPLWPLVLALSGGLAIVLLGAWWLFGRPADRSDPAPTRAESPLPETHVEQEELPPAVDLDEDADVAQAPAPAPSPGEVEPSASPEPDTIPQSAELSTPELGTPEAGASEVRSAEATTPEAEPDEATQTPSPPVTVSLRLASPDTQVQFEIRDSLDSWTRQTAKVGDIVDLEPGTYRVVASGPGLEAMERELELLGGQPAEYSVELCRQPRKETESLAGEILERRTCTSTVECESTFMILSEYAEQLVKDAAFRREQCTKWRAAAVPEGKWTLDTKCDGEVSATTCRVEIAEGACTVTGPRRTVRGEPCPRAELR